jgi:hypothetical protein
MKAVMIQRAVAGMVAGLMLGAAAAGADSAGDGPPPTAVAERLAAAVRWLAAPDREGRGPGTAGI